MGNQVQRTVNAYQGCEHRLPWSSKRSQLWGAFLNKFAVLVFVEMLPSFAKKATIVQCTGTLSFSSFCSRSFAVLVFVEMLPNFARQAVIVQCIGTLWSSSLC